MAETKTGGKTDMKPGRRPARPRVTIDRAYAERLEALAGSVERRNPAVAERLLEELGRARIVDSAKMPANVVTLGNAATYRDESTGREQTVILVFPGEADIASGRISVVTPIGAALLGLPEGASFWWDTRQGETRQLTVIRVGPAETAPAAASEGKADDAP